MICRTMGSASVYARRPVKRLPLDQLHHDGALFHTMNGGNVGMVQRSQHPCFPFESSHPVGVSGKLIRQHLDRNIAIELGVLSAIHRAHAAFAKLRDNAVVGDRGLGGHRAELRQ